MRLTERHTHTTSEDWDQKPGTHHFDASVFSKGSPLIPAVSRLEKEGTVQGKGKAEREERAKMYINSHTYVRISLNTLDTSKQ